MLCVVRDVRERLDRIALRILELPQLAWWSESFDPASYRLPLASRREWREYCSGRFTDGRWEVMPGSGKGPFFFSGAQDQSRGQSPRQGVPGCCRASGISWWPQSQI